MKKNKNQKAYIIGSGIAGLSAAVFLIKDGNFNGKNITIIDESGNEGGSFDGQGSPETGYCCRGYRLFEETVYSCTYDLLLKIPSPVNPQKNLKDDFLEFNKKVKVHDKARLVDKGKVLNAHRLGLNWLDRINLTRLFLSPEASFGNLEIQEYFTPEFFKTNFWFEWSTTFAFKPWHSLVEMKRYIVRFVQNAPEMSTLTCFMAMPYCEHDFIILPAIKLLQDNGVTFMQNCVKNIEFNKNKTNKKATGIILENGEKISLEKNDLLFITTASITSGASIGSAEKAPAIQKTSPSIWEIIAKNEKDFGNPSVFFAKEEKTQFEAFTITFSNPLFFNLVEKLSSNKAGHGGVITFKNSNWLISMVLPSQPYFINQPKETFVCWGYGAYQDKTGNYINKKMSDCSGNEILQEICYHLGFEDKYKEISEDAICIPALLPRITSQFMPRKKLDRPLVIPKGSKNFAFLGQYVEIPHEITFTVEGSVRSAKIAVKKLLNLKNKIPPLHQKQYNPKIMSDAIKAMIR